ncbi:MAG: thiolase family protein [Aquabacterium sp.]|uniref:thiolase family protein n=1 Tax=Aquabacterium sp. TaxID=1872578 RepID=UPI0027260A6D|nr:thiolase family protein [Aquabacterium sp.]MDO9005802.1 thiolase family protein [Aquabacterium sp.]
MSSINVVLCQAVRTAIGTFGGTLKDMPAPDLGALVVKHCLDKLDLGGRQIDGLIMGQVIQAGGKMNPARQAGISAGLSANVPAMTVNRVCGSGAQAILSSAMEIWAGVGKAFIAGGMENMDRAPYLLPQGRWGARMGDVPLLDSMLHDGLHDAFSGRHSGWHTEEVAALHHITREAQDQWALRSQQRFSTAQSLGKFDTEIVPLRIPGKKTEVVFQKDEHNRADLSLEMLSRLKPAFKDGGTITAGNAPGLNSGAAAMIVAEKGWAEQAALRPMARLAGHGVTALEPGLFGLGPVAAIRLALARAGWRPEDVDRYEINEAFAAVTLACIKELELPAEIVNVEGGAIAHGHPIGATGAVLVTRLLHAMQREGLRRGVVALCIGGGQGIALALEAMA